MGIVYTDLRLGNFTRPDLDEITVNAIADTGAIELVIPEHLAIQLSSRNSNRESCSLPTAREGWCVTRRR